MSGFFINERWFQSPVTMGKKITAIIIYIYYYIIYNNYYIINVLNYVFANE